MSRGPAELGASGNARRAQERSPGGSSADGRQRRSCARKGREILEKFLGVKLSRFNREPGKTWLFMESRVVSSFRSRRMLGVKEGTFMGEEARS